MLTDISTSYVFAVFQKGLHAHVATLEDYEQTIPTFLTLFIFGFLYELLLVWDALRLKNTIQIIGICMCNLGLLIYAAVQMDQIDEAVEELGAEIDTTVWPTVKPFLIAIPCVIAIATIGMSFVTRKLYDEFAWTIYKHISADLRMKRRYLTYQIYIALLKFDFFFFLGFTIQFIVIVASKNTSDVEFALTIAAVPVTIVLLLLAGYFTRKENKLGMAAIIILYFAGLAYFLFKLVRMYQNTSRAMLYMPARKSLTTFAVLTIILIILTIINAIICATNFQTGLEPYIRHRKVDDREGEEGKPVAMMDMQAPHLNMGGYVGGGASSRMTID
ncbi:MAG: hypothetical protein Q9163_001361 [Psora crenata]